MRRTYGYGFEGGNLYGLTPVGTAPTVQSSVVASGVYAMEVNLAGSTQGYVGLPINGVGATEFIHFAIRFAAIPTARRIILRAGLAGPSTTNLEVAIETNGTLTLRTNGGATLIGTSVTALAANQWYEIEIGVDHVTKYVALKINQVTEIDWVISSTLSASLGTDLYFGSFNTTETAALHFYLDDVCGDSEEWVGHEKVKRLDVTSLDADNANFTLGAGTNKYAAISEAIADDDTSYVGAPANTTDQIIYNLQDPSTDMVGIRAVWARIRAKREGATGSGILTPSFKYLGFVNDMNSISSGASYTTTLNSGVSATGCPVHPCWESEILKDTKIGFKSGSATIGTRLSQFFVEVSYSDTAGSDVDIPRREIISSYGTGDDSEINWTTNSSRSGSWSVAIHPSLGTPALRINPATGTAAYNGYGPYNDYFTTTRKTLFHKFDLYVVARPTSNFVEVWEFDGGGGVSASLRLYSDGSLEAYNAVGGAFGRTAAGFVPLNALTSIQIKCRVASSTTALDGLMQIYVNGALIIDYQNTRPSSTLTVLVRFGTKTVATGGCDFYISDILSDWCVLPPRDAKVTYLVPNGAGVTAGTGWTAVGDMPTWRCIDDPSGTAADDDTTYVKSPLSATDIQSYAMGDLPANAQSIVSMMMLIYGKRDAATSIAINFAVRSAQGGSPTFASLTAVATYASKGVVRAVSQGRGRWTPALINSAEASLQATSATIQFRVSRVIFVVEYETRILTFARSRGFVGMAG